METPGIRKSRETESFIILLIVSGAPRATCSRKGLAIFFLHLLAIQGPWTDVAAALYSVALNLTHYILKRYYKVQLFG